MDPVPEGGDTVTAAFTVTNTGKVAVPASSSVWTAITPRMQTLASAYGATAMTAAR